MPPQGRGDFHHDVGQNGSRNPLVVGLANRFDHGLADGWVVKNPVEERTGDRELQDGEKDLFHSPNRSFQLATDRRISSAVLRGLISQTNKQFGGRSGTSFSR